MTYGAILGVHVVAALVAGAGLFYALWAVVLGKESHYRAAALAVAFIATFEIATGTALAALSPALAAAALAGHIAFYLGLCLAVEILLFIRMDTAFVRFPFALTTSTVFGSLVLFVAAVGSGV